MDHPQPHGPWKFFPWDRHPEQRGNQAMALELIAKHGSLILELPVGSGKTAVGIAYLKWVASQQAGPLFYLVPNKTLVDQVKKLYPEVKVVYGRNEYLCHYYGGEDVSAEAAPCSMLDCPHRVDQQTGSVETPGFEPCPYLTAKFEAKQGGIVVATMSFYLYTQLFSREWDRPAGLVIDEAHRIARVFRNSMTYDITDHHLEKVIELLESMEADSAGHLREFRRLMIRTVKTRSPKKPTLLEAHEITELVVELAKVDSERIIRLVRQAIRSGQIDPKEKRAILKQTETITRSLHRYVRSLELSLPRDQHHPLSYTYAYFERDEGEEAGRNKVDAKLVIRGYYVAPLIQKLLAARTLAYSATIGDPQVFGYETGIKLPFFSLESDFPSDNTRIYLPTDTPNLSFNECLKRRQSKTRALRQIAKACQDFSRHGLRSLVIVVSNAERQKFLTLAAEEGLHAVSYGDGVKPREITETFKSGIGDALVGTVANFGEGVDLPNKIAPVIFFLRPAYPNASDPETMFEERRFGSQRWGIWNWRVMLEAMQVRGRNVRSLEDLGVCFFISQQFGRFLLGATPKWLQRSFVSEKTFAQCVENAKELLLEKELV